MNATAIIGALTSIIKTATELAPAAVAAEQVAEPIAKLIWDHLVNKKVVTQTDIDNIGAQMKALSARIQAPLPPEQADDV